MFSARYRCHLVYGVSQCLSFNVLHVKCSFSPTRHSKNICLVLCARIICFTGCIHFTPSALVFRQSDEELLVIWALYPSFFVLCIFCFACIMSNVYKFKMLENYTKKSIFVYFDYLKMTHTCTTITKRYV